ncbi:MAG: hypothetical protein ACK40O_00875 [Allosphingosinicella sp.]
MSSAAAGKALRRLLAAQFPRFRGLVDVELVESSDWNSVTFTGARHHLRVLLEGEGAGAAASAFLEELIELELPITGHLVAEIGLRVDERRDGGAWARVELDALTVEVS